MTRLAATIGEAWLRLIRHPGLAIPIVVIAVNVALTLIVEFAVLQNFPHSGDEYAYRVSAESFSRGRLSAPSPPLREFFDVDHVLNDGRFYGKYPPGWPALLAVGILLRVPWIVNPALGALALLLIYRLARRHVAQEVANIALLLSLGNPFVVFTSASYFSHAACLLFCVLFLKFLLEALEDPGKGRVFLGLGLSAGIAFTIRPYTAVALLLPGLFFLLLRGLRSTSIAVVLRGVSLAGLTFSVAAALLLCYDWALTGNALLQPFQRYDPSDAPRLPESVDAWSARLKSHGLLRLWQLNTWLPLTVVFLLLAATLREVRRDVRIRLCLSSFGALFAAYFFYWGDGVVQFGPRYLYESLAVLLVVGATVTAHFGRWGWLMLLGVIVLNVATFRVEARTAATETAALREIDVQVRELGLAKCIVFAPRPMAPMWGAPGGVTDFDADVLIVRDRGSDNRELLRRFPDRKGYRVAVDAAGRRRLSPIDD